MKKWIIGVIATVFVASGAYVFIGNQTVEDGDWEVQIRRPLIGDAGGGGARPVAFYFAVKDGVECNCGTTKALTHWKNLPEPARRGCRAVCYDIFAAPENRCAMCNGELCRFGLSDTYSDAGEPNVCSVDSPGCVAWPCTVIIGHSPTQYALDHDIIDAGIGG